MPSTIYLQAFILELIIKIFYELDTGKCAPHKHELNYFYAKLNPSTRELIQKEFNNKILGLFKLMESQVKEKIYEPIFEEMLTGNCGIVMHFKYEPKLKNGSLPNIDFLMALRDDIELRTGRERR